MVGALVGCIMAVRRDVSIEVGGHNPDIMGPMLLGDGETGLQRKLLEGGQFRVIYDPEIGVRHHVPKKRMNFEYLERRYWNEGACHAYRFFQTQKPSTPLLLVLSGYWALRSILKSIQAKFPGLLGATRAEMSRFIGAFFRRQSSFYLKLAVSKEFRQFVAREQWV